MARRANGGEREELRYSAAGALKVYEGKAGEVTGKITKIYRLDGDASDNHAVVLEGLDGKAYFVPLLRAPELWDNKNAAWGGGSLLP